MNKKNVIKKINSLVLEGIAHRGLHNKELTENGLAAFTKAINENFAFELDVHLTKDGKLLVCHDEELLRTTGKEGIIEELTLQDIQTNYHLLDGEKIPSFEEVLALTQEKVPIVVEMKVYKGNFEPLAKELKKELSIIQDKKNIIIISFDPRALLSMKDEGFIRLLLVSTDEKHRWTYRLRGFFDGLDLDYLFMKDKKVQRYAKKHFINVWTIDNKEKFEEVYPYVDTITFENMDEENIRNSMRKKKDVD